MSGSGRPSAPRVCPALLAGGLPRPTPGALAALGDQAAQREPAPAWGTPTSGGSRRSSPQPLLQGAAGGWAWGAGCSGLPARVSASRGLMTPPAQLAWLSPCPSGHCRQLGRARSGGPSLGRVLWTGCHAVAAGGRVSASRWPHLCGLSAGVSPSPPQDLGPAQQDAPGGSVWRRREPSRSVPGGCAQGGHRSCPLLLGTAGDGDGPAGLGVPGNAGSGP